MGLEAKRMTTSNEMAESMLSGLQDPEQVDVALWLLSLLADLVSNRHTGQVILDCRDGIPEGARVIISTRRKRK